jgi:hypothetical protein
MNRRFRNNRTWRICINDKQKAEDQMWSLEEHHTEAKLKTEDREFVI